MAETGVVSAINVGGSTVAEDLGLMIIKPGWDGKWLHQAEVEGISRDGDAWSGEVATEAGPIRLEQRVDPTDSGLRVTWTITPEQAVSCEGIFIQLLLPVDRAAGSARWYRSGAGGIDSAEFPVTLPRRYHLVGGSADWIGWVLGDGNGMRVRLDGTMLRDIALQDDRQFDIENFELQIPVRDTRRLEAGLPVEFSLVLEALTADDVADEEAARVAAEEREKVRFESDKPLRIGSLPEVGGARRYEVVEWPLDVEGTWTNPFDPREIDVEATITQPDGEHVRVPGFFTAPYDREVVDGQEHVTKSGDCRWMLRFCPSQQGKHSLTVRATDRTGAASTEPVTFTVGKSPSPGFIRRSAATPYYLEFDDGTPYFAVGENVCWAGSAGTADYDLWFPPLGKSGGNFARIWLVNWNMGLEWIPDDPSARGRYYGLGLYSLDNAARLDYVMDLARDCGVYTMLALGYHGELQDREDFFNSQAWDRSPYNAANGGPCDKPADFWVYKEARRLYKQRLRYYVARWGCYTNVQSWEFWNEVHAPADWVAEMAAYLRETDPYRHLITTTYGDDDVWRVADIDFTQTHSYGSDEGRHDAAPSIAHDCASHTEKFGKPHLVGEFGIDWKCSDAEHDPEGHAANLHNGLWAGMASRGLGGAMNWWWDGYIHPLDLYHEFTALSRFANKVPWNELDARLLTNTTPRLVEGGEGYRELPVEPVLGFQRATGTDFLITPDGRVMGEGEASKFVYPPGKEDLYEEMRFTVECPVGGEMVVHVQDASVKADLSVLVDGEVAWERVFECGPEGEGDYKSTKWSEVYEIWQSVWDEEFTVHIPPGEHVIEMRNDGPDWVQVDRYLFRGCVEGRYTNALIVRGVQTDDTAVLWLQNRESNWYNRTKGIEIEPVPPVTFDIIGLRDGIYRVEWVDTSTGLPTSRERVKCVDGRLTLAPEPVESDVACRVTPRNRDG